jgi:NTE family protein
MTREKLESAFSILNQTSGFLTYLNVEEQIRALRKHDVLVQPNLEGIGTLQFEKVEEALKRGVAGAEAVEEKLSALSVPEAEFQDFLRRQRRPPKPLPIVDELRVADVDGVDSRWITRRILTRPGRPLDLALLREDFGRIYELGDFDVIDYHLRQENGRTVLEIAPHLKPIAHGRFRLGLNFTTDFNTQSFFDFRLGYTETRLNRLRADWRTRVVLGNTVSLDTEFYQPLDYSGRFFLAPHVGFTRQRVTYYDTDFAALVVRFDTPYAGFDTGISFGKYGEFRLGYLRGRSSLGSIVSPVDLAGLTIDHGKVVARAAFDQLDNVSFPSQGYHVTAEADFGRTGLGGQSDFDKFTFSGQKIFRWGGSSIDGGLFVATPLGGTLPFWEWTSLGGPLQLSGLRPNQLLGPYAGLGRLVAYRPLGPGGTAGTFYAGASLEAGNAWQTTKDIKLSELRYSGSLFLGVDSPLGPVYLGVGVADGGNTSVYLLIGTDFR